MAQITVMVAAKEGEMAATLGRLDVGMIASSFHQAGALDVPALEEVLAAGSPPGRPRGEEEQQGQMSECKRARVVRVGANRRLYGVVAGEQHLRHLAERHQIVQTERQLPGLSALSVVSAPSVVSAQSRNLNERHRLPALLPQLLV